jgi:hypothetical protein
LNTKEDKLISFEKLNQNSKSDLLNLIDNLLKNIDNNSKDRAYLQEFYTRLDSTIALTELTKTVQNFKQNKSIIPMNNGNNNNNNNNNKDVNKSYKKHQTSVIINNLSSRDREDIEFKNKSQVFRKQNTFGAFNEFKTENEKTELKVEDLDDEFDHTK